MRTFLGAVLLMAVSTFLPASVFAQASIAGAAPLLSLRAKQLV